MSLVYAVIFANSACDIKNVSGIQFKLKFEFGLNFSRFAFGERFKRQEK